MIDTASLADDTVLATRLFLDIVEGVLARPVAPSATMGHIEDQFRGTLGEQGVGLRQTLDEFRANVLPIPWASRIPVTWGS